MGVAKPSWRQPILCRLLGVFAWVLVLAACSGSWRLALHDNCQFGAGLRRRTALVATTPRED